VTDNRSPEWIAELSRINAVFNGSTDDAIMDGLRQENLHRCPGCKYLDCCQAQCQERSPLTALERNRIDAYRIEALLSA